MATFSTRAEHRPPSEPNPAEGKKASLGSTEALETSKYYVALEDFSIAYNGDMLAYSTGDIISSPYMIAYLLREKAPIMLSEEAGEPICCPHCQKSFFNK